MNNSFHYSLMMASTSFQKKVMNRLNCYDLTTGQPKVLEYLTYHDGCTQKEIAEGCGTDPATITGLLSRMEDKKYIERRFENGNRRSTHVYLTDHGKHYAGIVLQTFNELELEVLSNIDSQDREVFITVLGQLLSNMREQEEQ